MNGASRSKPRARCWSRHVKLGFSFFWMLKLNSASWCCKLRVNLRIQNFEGKLQGLSDCKSITREKPVLFPPLRIGSGGHQQSLLSRQLRNDSCSQSLPWACKSKANGFATYRVPVQFPRVQIKFSCSIHTWHQTVCSLTSPFLIETKEKTCRCSFIGQSCWCNIDQCTSSKSVDNVSQGRLKTWCRAENIAFGRVTRANSTAPSVWSH